MVADLDLELRTLLLESNADELGEWLARPNRETRRALKHRRPPHHAVVLRGGRPMVKCGDKLYPFISGGAERTVRVRLEALVSGYQAKMAQASASTRAFGANVISSAEKNKQAFTTLGFAAAGMGAAIVLGLKRATGASIEYEAIVAKMVTQNGMARAEVERLSEAALRLGDAGKGPRELADALFFITSSGLEGNAALEVLEASAMAAAIGLGETKTVADAVTSAVNAYGPEIITAAEATDVLLGTVREGKADAPELAGAIGKVVPIAANMGITFNDVGASLAAMTRTGTDAATASTQLRAIMVSLLKPAKQSEDALRGVGLSSEQLRATIREKGLWAALMALKKAVGDNDAVMARIFPNVRALSGVLDLVGASTKSNAGIFENMGDVLGMTADAHEEWSKTAEAAGARFSASLETAQIALGAVFLPALTMMLDVGTDVVGLFSSLPGPVRTVGAVLAAAAGATLLLGGGFLLLAPQIAAARAAMVTLAGTTSILRGSLSMTAGFLMGPWGIALTAATVGLTLWSNAKREAKERTDAYIASIEADSGAIAENTRAQLANRLETEGVLEAMGQLGIESSTLVDAILGDAEAVDRLNVNLEAAEERHRALIHEQGPFAEGADAMERGIDKVRGALNGESEAIEAGVARYRRIAAAKAEAITVTDGWDHATRKSTESTEDNTAATADLGDELEGVEGDIEAVVTAAEQLQDAFDGLAGGKVSVEKALISYRNTLKRVREAIDDNGNTLDINTQKGRDNRDSILGSVDAAFEHAKAVVEQTDNVERGTKTFQRHIEELMGVADESGLTREAVHKYLKELNLLPKDVKTLLKLMGVESAEEKAARLEAKLNRMSKRVWTVAVQFRSLNEPVYPGSKGGSETKHAGGVVGTAGALRTGGLRPDEVSLIAQRGEMVLSKADVMHGGRATMAGPQRLQGAITITNWATGAAYFEGVAVDVINSEAAGAGARDRLGGRRAVG